MNDDLPDMAADRILAGFDFARAAAAAKDAHRAEMERLLAGLLDVVDSLDALQALTRDATGEPSPLGKTVDRTRRQALQVLAEAGVAPIESTGKLVDLSDSEIVEMRPAAAADDVVVEEVVRGYRWRGQLFRRARVVIARGSGESDGAAAQRPKGEAQ